MSVAVKLPIEEKKEIAFKWNQRILIVEDQMEIANSYKDILNQQSISEMAKSSRSSRSSRASGSEESNVIPLNVDNKFNFELTVVHSAADAILKMKEAIANNKPYAMGFIDVLLGEGMDGIELAHELLKIDSQFYLVFVTAYHDRDINSIHKLLGEDNVDHWDYLNKPFTEGEIVQKARNLVSLWNLHKEKDFRENQMSEMRKQLFENERFSAVAAVARGVSHEFGNILVQIMGKAELGMKQNEEKMRDSLSKIFDASQRASDILDRFNDISNPKKSIKDKTLVSVPSLIDGVISLMEHQIKTSGAKVCKIKMDKVEAMLNETSILQVLTNLTINSLYAMDNSGQIDFSVLDKGDKVEIHVRDYGPGVPEENLYNVLEAFYTTKGEEGTGLGLSICKEIIEIEHQGHFQLQNHEIKGLEAIIILPKNGGLHG